MDGKLRAGKRIEMKEYMYLSYQWNEFDHVNVIYLHT